MNVLFVDSTTEKQAFYGTKFSSVQESHFTSCELHLRLASPEEYSTKLADSNLLILGSGLKDKAVGIALQVKQLYPEIEILLFLAEHTGDSFEYSAFENALAAGVRKILPDNASNLDILQELLVVHNELKRSGKIREAKLFVVKSVKGGTGATTLVAALAEVCSDANKKVLIWDFDCETRDLSRALSVNSTEFDKKFEGWLESPRSITRESFTNALAPLSNCAKICSLLLNTT